jgi:hypothetical protein
LAPSRLRVNRHGLLYLQFLLDMWRLSRCSIRQPLTSGNVLVCGGIDSSGNALSFCELYNPTARQVIAESLAGSVRRSMLSIRTEFLIGTSWNTSVRSETCRRETEEAEDEGCRRPCPIRVKDVLAEFHHEYSWGNEAA